MTARECGTKEQINRPRSSTEKAKRNIQKKSGNKYTNVGQ